MMARGVLPDTVRLELVEGCFMGFAKGPGGIKMVS